MPNLVFLPATAPGDETYGVIPDRIEAYPAASIRRVHYPTMVWYSEAIRREAIAQIRSFGVRPVILLGFSKSGLGAWNIVRAIPDCISGTVIFDAPVACEKRPARETAPFYKSDKA